MNNPYRTADIVPYEAPTELQGALMTKWTLDHLSLEWNHGEDWIVVQVAASNGAVMKTQIDVDAAKELRAMLDKAISESTYR